MITEDDLTRLLAEAAESAPPPGPAPDALLATLTGPADEPPVRPTAARPWGRRILAVAAAVLLVTFGAGVVTGSDDRTAVEPTSGAQDEASAPATTIAPNAVAGGGSSAGSPTADGSAAGGALAPGSPGASAAGGGGGGGGGGATVTAQDGAKVVKTGSLDLEVPEGTFARVVDRITAQVVGLDGYIAEQTTSQGDDAQSGSIVVRVPEASFDALLTELRGLGEVQAVTSKGTDVTAQHTDLVARLGALTAARDRLGTVLAEASTVGDILMVQDRITMVQAEIESYQGQIRLLEDQASMATLTVTVAEPGADAIAATAAGDGGLGHAWEDARERFGDGVEALVGWSGVAVLILLVGAVVALIARFARPLVRRRML